MANDFWNSWDSDWSDYYNAPQEALNINELLWGNDRVVDHHAQTLFKEAFFENDQGAYLDLIDYMWDEYGIDFEDAWAWDDFRDWYNGT